MGSLLEAREFVTNAGLPMAEDPEGYDLGEKLRWERASRIG
jgi:hypothetical protein